MTVLSASSLGPAVISMESGLRRTSVHVNAEEFIWWVRAGADAPEPLLVAAPEAMANLDRTTTPACQWVRAQPTPDGVILHARSALSAAFCLRTASADQLLPSLAPLADGLDRLHRCDGPAMLGPTPAIRRLVSWLDGASRCGGAVRLRDLAVSAWGARGLAGLRDWAAVATGVEGGMLHGNVSLGAVLPSTAGTGELEVLSGTDLSRGAPEFDYGWILGELLELRFVRSGLDPAGSLTLADDALACTLVYGRDGLDPDALGRTMLLRIVTHLHDFAAYMPWNDELLKYIDFVSLLLDLDLSLLPPKAAHV